MTLSKPQQAGILVVLALVMAGTRINHFGALPDASWAVFFVAGFYLRGTMRWAFPLLMALAVLVDFLVISSQGLSFWNHYCVSAAYWFLIPAYASMWAGGAVLRALDPAPGLRGLGLLASSFLVAFSACFLVSNGSFYWLSASVTMPGFGGWLENMGDWYLPYLQTAVAYAGVAAVAHAFGARWLRTPGRLPHASGQRG